MHNKTEESSIIARADTQRLVGELEIDYQHNRVMFHPNERRELTFSLPLTPSDIDIVRSLAATTQKLEARGLRN